jgi:hypothetical protein
MFLGFPNTSETDPVNPLIIQALKFAGPALRLLFSQMALSGTQAFLANIVLKLLDQATGVAASGGSAQFGASASAAAGVELPPEHEWTEDGIRKWADAHTDDDGSGFAA